MNQNSKIFIILMLLFNGFLFAFAGGDGSEGNPYQVSTLADLHNVSNFLSSHFIQINDIDASDTQNWNSGTGFSPIGNTANPFGGSYDGQEYRITALFINRADTIEQGLFGFVDNAELKNIILIDCDITGNDRVGGLAGSVGDGGWTSTIENCSTSGEVNGDYAIGGLIGRMNDCNCIESFSSADVTCIGDGQRTGGLIGYVFNTANITNCYAAGNVDGNNKVGGLVGELDTSLLQFSYSCGEVICSGSDVGGLIGFFQGGEISDYIIDSYWNTDTSGQTTSNGGTGITTSQMQNQSFYPANWDFDDTWEIDQNYNSGFPILKWYPKTKPVVVTTIAHNITSSSAVTGGNVTSSNGFTITDRGVCYSTSPEPTLDDNITSNGIGIGEFTSNLSALSISTEYFYRAYATNSEGTSYGEEYSFITYPLGYGTSSNPYQISSLFALKWLSETPAVWDKYFIQTADIDAIDTQNWNDGEGFYPIGSDDDSTFSGSYVGDDHVISNLYINRSNEYVGLFGYADKAYINHLSVLNANIIGGDFCGILAGYIYYYEITHVITSGTVSSSNGNWIGGMCGKADMVNISDCSSSATVTGSDCVGGLLGLSQFRTTVDSYATGNVSGESNTGGFAGKRHGGTIQRCYATGNVSETYSYTGGFVGYIGGSGSIENCYSLGDVNGSNHVGGFIGKIYLECNVTKSYSTGNVNGSGTVGGFAGTCVGNITSCFWDTETSGQSTSAGSATGLTTYQMQLLPTYLNAGWDFAGETVNGTDDIWILLQGEYPTFANNYTAPLITVVDDVPNDQGHQVFVVWDKSNLDTHAMSSRYYSVWMQIEYGRAIDPQAIVIDDLTDFSLSEENDLSNYVLRERDNYWTCLSTVPGMGDETYLYIATTQVDSSTVLPPEDYTSTFKVCYHFESGYFSSPSSEGYSVDNIAPNPTENIQIVMDNTNRNNSIAISWAEVTEGTYQGNSYPELNGIWYKIYFSETPDFICDETTFLASTQLLSYDVDTTGFDKMFFKIVVSDQEL